MNVKVKKNSETAVELTITIPFSEFEPKVNAVYKQLGSNAKIPGFRKGKVPKAVLDTHYSKEGIFASAVQDNIQSFIGQALHQEHLQIVHPGETELKQLPKQEGDDLVIFASMEVIPPFDLPDFKKLTIKVDEQKVSDKEINERIDILRKQFGSLEPKQGANKDKVENGDFVQMDIVITKDGKTIEDNKNISYEVGLNANNEAITGVNNALLGLKEGQDKTFDSLLTAGKYANQNVSVNVKVHKINTQVLQKLDNDFVKMASEFNTVAELKKSIKDIIAKEKLNLQLNQAKDELMKQLIKTIDIPVPEKLLESRTKNLIDPKKTSADEKKNIIATESNRIKDSFIIEKLIATAKVEVKNEEVMQYFEQMGQMYGLTGQQMMQQAHQSHMLNDVVNGLSGNKALDTFIKDVAVVDSSGQKIKF